MTEDELYEMICSLDFCQNIATADLTSDLFLSHQSTFTPKISRAFFTILTRSLRGFIQQSEEQRYDFLSYLISIREFSNNIWHGVQ